MIDQVPTADGKGGWAWADQASAISSLKDVELIDLKNSQSLVWDEILNKWTNKTISNEGGPTGKVELLYHLTGTTPADTITLSTSMLNYDLVLFTTYNLTLQKVHQVSCVYSVEALQTAKGNNEDICINIQTNLVYKINNDFTKIDYYVETTNPPNTYIDQIYGIKLGTGISEIPIATNEILGGIKVGNYLNITNEGILSAAVDKELSAESNNPIAASAVYNALNNLIVLDEEEF